MLRQRVHQVGEWLKRVVTRPRSELTRWQAAVRFAYDLGRYGARQLREDRATEMAAALAFRTLFAIFPVAVVATVVYQGFRGIDHLHELVADLIDAAGLYDVEVTPLEDESAVEPEEGRLLGEWLEEFVAQVADVPLEAIGWIGLLVVVYAAVTMMVTIEETFNAVYRAPQGRSWSRRIPIYWTVLTLGPLAVGLILFIDARVEAWMGQREFWGWALSGAGVLWSFAIIWMTLLAVYVLVPNTRVAWRPALVGALVAGIAVQVGKSALGQYIATFLTVRQLFGTIGFIPLFMFWVYIMWLVILFGLELSASLQLMGGRRRMEEMEERRQRTGVVDPTLVLLVMEEIAGCFLQGRPASVRHLGESTSVPEATVTQMIDRLCRAGLVNRVEGDERLVSLARPPEQITADQMIEVGFAMVDETDRSRKSALITRLREAQRDLARGSTLDALAREHTGDAAVSGTGHSHAEAPRTQRGVS